MKAKEYVEFYREARNKEQVLIKIAKSFLEEVRTMIKARNARSDRAILSIFEELDKKWRALCFRVDGLAPEDWGDVTPKYEGFQNMIRQVYPEAYEAWKNQKNVPK